MIDIFVHYRPLTYECIGAEFRIIKIPRFIMLQSVYEHYAKDKTRSIQNAIFPLFQAKESTKKRH